MLGAILAYLVDVVEVGRVLLQVLFKPSVSIELMMRVSSVMLPDMIKSAMRNRDRLWQKQTKTNRISIDYHQWHIHPLEAGERAYYSGHSLFRGRDTGGY